LAKKPDDPVSDAHYERHEHSRTNGVSQGEKHTEEENKYTKAAPNNLNFKESAINISNPGTTRAQPWEQQQQHNAAQFDLNKE
jgi:hypothetical protein